MEDDARLEQSEILKLHSAAVSARLDASRTELLAGLPLDFVASMPRAATPGGQLLADLGALNGAGVLVDGTVPLAIWLRNARALASPQKESVEIERILALLESKSRSPAATRAADKIPSLHLPSAPGPLKHFVGRKREMEELSAACAPKANNLIVLWAIGGQGKTQLTFQWLHAELDRGELPFETIIFYSTYRFGADFRYFLSDTASILGTPPLRRRDALIPDLVEGLHARPTLVILDGVERWLKGWRALADPQFAQRNEDRDEQLPQSEGLMHFLQGFASQRGRSRLILTTRAVPRGIDDLAYTDIGTTTASRGLPGLSDGEGADLLRKLEVHGTEDELRAASRELGGHPLALRAIGRRLAELHGGDVRRRRRLNGLGAEKIEQLFEDVANDLRDEVPLLHVAALCLGDAPIRALAAGHQKEEEDVVRGRLSRLSAWGLLRTTEEDAVVLHPLVARHFGQPGEDDVEIHRRLSEYFSSQPFDATRSDLREAQFRVWGVEHALRAGDGRRAAELFVPHNTGETTLSRWLSRSGNYEVAYDIGKRILGAPDLLRHDPLWTQVVRSVHQDLRNAGRTREAVDFMNNYFTEFET